MFNTLLLFLGLITAPNPPKDIYSFSFKTLDGKEVKLSKFKGKKILIVNTASKCGYTKQYEDLEKLHKQYGKNVVLIGFPSANFGGQELGSNAEIKEFCSSKFNTTFLIAEKSNVKGEGISPLFQYLTTQTNPDFTGDIKWNFEKFLINEKGELVHRYRSAVKPLDEQIVKNF
ncbi:glutathione peroxidase [Pedobacter chitinilyticus]|uniref:Glutathione peroxidase n=1 Tax=Pedobacter chitinilyticus TaxID=2233776 RepID=A0A3S3SU78_9SPHI|nr:glutathione peroxidase [Pedobacter chitinilyticus]RWU10476.1 glutathione peroxidase [Pedobacter chitinilyticus]